MKKLWNRIDSKECSFGMKIRIFMLLNCIIFSLFGFVIWLAVRNFAFNSVENALCFVGYAGFCIGPLVGFVFLCRQ